MQRYYIKRTYNLAIVFALLVSKQISHTYLKSTKIPLQMISLTVNLYSSTPQRPEALGPRFEQRPLYLGRDVKNTNRLTH